MQKVKKSAILILLLLLTITTISLAIFAKKYFQYSIKLPQISYPKDNLLDKFVSYKAKNINDQYEEMLRKLKNQHGEFGIYIKNMDTGETYSHNETILLYGASLYKVPVAVAVLKQIQDNKLTLDTKLYSTQADYEQGSGIIFTQRLGSSYTVEQLLKYLINDSDNMAQNILLRAVPYLDIENAFYLGEQKFESKFITENLTFSSEYGEYLYRINKSNYLNGENKKYLIELMMHTSFDNRLSAYLNNNLKFAHKIGNWIDSWHDCGLIFGANDDYAVCIMSQDMSFEGFLDVSKIVAEFINEL